MVLIDTPGLMWPKIEHASDGLMLAASHAIGANAVIERRSGGVPRRSAAGALSGPADGALRIPDGGSWTVPA